MIVEAPTGGACQKRGQSARAGYIEIGPDAVVAVKFLSWRRKAVMTRLGIAVIGTNTRRSVEYSASNRPSPAWTRVRIGGS